MSRLDPKPAIKQDSVIELIPDYRVAVDANDEQMAAPLRDWFTYSNGKFRIEDFAPSNTVGTSAIPLVDSTVFGHRVRVAEGLDCLLCSSAWGWAYCFGGSGAAYTRLRTGESVVVC